MRMLRPLSISGAVLAAVVLLAPAAEAQMRQASAEVVRATGRVEALRKGQTQWVAAAPGARLVEGDQIRAMAGASADLSLPDGSTILVAENTRFAVTKLEYDARTRDRNAAFHLVAGKVRAQVARAAVQLVRARESNFTISTPAGVAAVRGTIPVVFYNPATQQAIVFSIPSPGEDPSAARITFFNFATGVMTTFTGNTFVTIQGNQPTSAPTPIASLSPAAQAQIQTAVNQATAGSGQLTAPTVFIVSEAQIQSILTQLAGPTPVLTPSSLDTPAPTGSLGQDVQNQPPPAPSCASPPC